MFRVVLCECMQNLTQKETLGHTPGHLTRNSQIRLKKGSIFAFITDCCFFDLFLHYKDTKIF